MSLLLYVKWDRTCSHVFGIGLDWIVAHFATPILAAGVINVSALYCVRRYPDIKRVEVGVMIPVGVILMVFANHVIQVSDLMYSSSQVVGRTLNCNLPYHE
jgi:hypothetical protein